MRKDVILIIFLITAGIIGSGCKAKIPINPPKTPEAELIGSQTAIGDSITRGFNGRGCGLGKVGCQTCSNDNEPKSSWTTGDHAFGPCIHEEGRIVSHYEKINCTHGEKIAVSEKIAVDPEATMLGDFYNQAVLASDFLIRQPRTRYVTIWLGHNDICAGRINKTGNVCDNEDQDPANHCRTTEHAFERELRRGLDELIRVPNIKIGIAAPTRVSELCVMKNEQACGIFTIFDTCLKTWSGMAGISKFFTNGICKTLTTDCSDERIADTYLTGLAYRDIIKRVSAEYAAYTPGRIDYNPLFGTGGGFKETSVEIVYSDAPWNLKLSTKDVGCCDCFHPSEYGQNKISSYLWEGLWCSETEPCCDDSLPGDSALNRGLCESTTVIGKHPGFFE